MSDSVEQPSGDLVTRVEFEAAVEAVNRLKQDRATLKAALFAAGVAVPMLVSE